MVLVDLLTAALAVRVTRGVVVRPIVGPVGLVTPGLAVLGTTTREDVPTAGQVAQPMTVRAVLVTLVQASLAIPALVALARAARRSVADEPRSSR